MALCTLNSRWTRDHHAEETISFPPGWPEHNYIYHVPLSSITLECFGFTIQAELDSQIVYNLLARAWRPFANPAQRRLPAARIRHDLDGFWWEEEAQDESFTYLHILLPTEPKLDYGQMADTIAGMLQIAIDYPHITIHCRAQDEYDGGLQVIALPNLAWSEPEGATAR